MKSELPMKSIRFINTELWGINRFKTNPATKAPIICSTPATSAKKAEKKTTDSTKIYWEDFSLSNFFKNHRVIRGTTINIMIEKKANEVSRRTQNVTSNCPLDALEIIAKIIKTAVSVRMVPPTVIATELCLDKPNLLIMGYATKVCVANMLDVNKLASGERCNP